MKIKIRNFNLLKRIRGLEVERNFLKEQLEKKQKENMENICKILSLEEKIKFESIPKQKVIDKIEKLEEDIKDFEQTDNTERFKRENCVLLYKKEALQELLEGEENE